MIVWLIVLAALAGLWLTGASLLYFQIRADVRRGLFPKRWRALALLPVPGLGHWFYFGARAQVDGGDITRRANWQPVYRIPPPDGELELPPGSNVSGATWLLSQDHQHERAPRRVGTTLLGLRPGECYRFVDHRSEPEFGWRDIRVVLPRLRGLASQVDMVWISGVGVWARLTWQADRQGWQIFNTAQRSLLVENGASGGHKDRYISVPSGRMEQMQPGQLLRLGWSTFTLFRLPRMELHNMDSTAQPGSALELVVTGVATEVRRNAVTLAWFENGLLFGEVLVKRRDLAGQITESQLAWDRPLALAPGDQLTVDEDVIQVGYAE